MIESFCKFVSISTEPQLRHFMNCYYHPCKPAIAQCPDCGNGLCRERIDLKIITILNPEFKQYICLTASK